ncbi:MAG: methyltransferase domain-containing protein, partial [Aliifodinibius sp.]|nr:methyltransferase domain-containing protein [candidate division Zixibacteria bacterium]NIT59405.1 methyltransferase domain-containing protein [Fodinibius sp.]NIW46925.1 methyltransferase domain-containing protein [Gammaproteobacteria bacterium]NIR65796.1 methyltransferase domain-containing protein [candidate division Zixibacteria bacterium]NIS47455.1 methyltransferase domain-containing protein [candidate division Zixibacteria bacterium]
MTSKTAPSTLDLNSLRKAVQDEYRVVAENPENGFHFHVGRAQIEILDYPDELLEGIPEIAVESVAGTGNPFNIKPLEPGENVVDIGSGAGIDSLIAARMVAPDGQVVGVDMTESMLKKANRAKEESGFENVQFKYGFGEDLPV